MLYIVGTPIGNLDDISLRQSKTLSLADIILAEDTRSATILIQGIKERFPFPFNPSQKIFSYYKDNEFEKLPEVIERLQDNQNICLISESGLPIISDPGYLLIKTVIKQSLPFTVIPGPSAFASAIISSGFQNNEFMFIGFLPRKKSEIVKIFTKFMKTQELFPNMILSFYESPLRMNDTIQIIHEMNWNPEIVICREMTKKFEEIIRGKANALGTKTYRGELSVVLK